MPTQKQRNKIQKKIQAVKYLNVWAKANDNKIEVTVQLLIALQVGAKGVRLPVLTLLNYKLSIPVIYSVWVFHWAVWSVVYFEKALWALRNCMVFCLM